jgi:hypothetical protein
MQQQMMLDPKMQIAQAMLGGGGAPPLQMGAGPQGMPPQGQGTVQ